MTTNNYSKRNIQKGFLSGVAGCVDHTFMLGEALQERIRDKLAFVVSWIDLENAYGSVAHNLIQFALNWYHVPSFIQELIFDYERLCAFVVTEGWTTLGSSCLTLDSSKAVCFQQSFSTVSSTSCLTFWSRFRFLGCQCGVESSS